MNTQQTVQVFKALMQGPVSRIDLATRIGVRPKTIGTILVALQKEKLIHVLDYAPHGDGRNRVKIYSLGEGENALPKSGQSQEERSRKSYLRKIKKQNIFTPLTTFIGGKSLWQ